MMINLNTFGNGVDYPVITLNVMELIQDKMAIWMPGNALNRRMARPQIKDVIWASGIHKQGIDIENENGDKNRQPITHKQAGRIYQVWGMNEAGSIIRSLTAQSVQTEKQKTVDRRINETVIMILRGF